jgi:hypothetical protein
MTASREPRVGLPLVIPPASLKERVLDAANAAATGGRPVAPSPAGRLSLWDLAWAAALLVLVAGHVWLSLSRRPSDGAAQARPTLEVRALDPKLEGPAVDKVAGRASAPSEGNRAQAQELMRQI